MTAVRWRNATPAAYAERDPELPAYTDELARDLRAAVEGEVRFDSGSRAVYSYDASVFRQVPIGVVIPRHATDVVAAVDVCRQHGAPILPRGCGTGLAGQSVNTAVVFDFSKYMSELI